MDTDLEWVSKQETATQVEGISYASHLQACPPAVDVSFETTVKLKGMSLLRQCEHIISLETREGSWTGGVRPVR